MKEAPIDLAAKRRISEQMLEDEFLQTEWGGCAHLDCVAGCSQSIDSGHCERFARAFDAWRSKRSAMSPASRGGARE